MYLYFDISNPIPRNLTYTCSYRLNYVTQNSYVEGLSSNVNTICKWGLWAITKWGHESGPFTWDTNSYKKRCQKSCSLSLSCENTARRCTVNLTIIRWCWCPDLGLPPLVLKHVFLLFISPNIWHFVMVTQAKTLA